MDELCPRGNSAESPRVFRARTRPRPCAQGGNPTSSQPARLRQCSTAFGSRQPFWFAPGSKFATPNRFCTNYTFLALLNQPPAVHQHYVPSSAIVLLYCCYAPEKSNMDFRRILRRTSMDTNAELLQLLAC